MKKIIIFRTDRLGDYIIHSRPIYELKKKIPNSFITIVCSKLNYKILSECKHIDKLIIFEKNYSFLKKLKIFFSIILEKYFAVFVLDGKKFSYICNMFIISEFKFGIIYKSFFKILNMKIILHKPSRIYTFLFFKKYEIFTSKKYLFISENFCEKYLNLFNFFNLNLSILDKYHFCNTSESTTIFDKFVDKLNLKEYILIHLDEKWLDIDNHNNNIVNGIKKIQSLTNKKIIITSFNNNLNYFSKIKKSFLYFNYINQNLDSIKSSEILILDNLDIFLFEKFIKNSIINISCHSGFLVQVCGANNGKIIDIINEIDFNWYNCWKPNNTFHKFIFKSNLRFEKINPIHLFTNIAKIINNNLND